MAELHVVATIPARPESADAVAALLATLQRATREEEGCLAYEVYQSAAVPGTFVTVERWRDQQDLDAHLASEHVSSAIAQAGDHLSGEIAIHPLRPIG